jgi:hypothetical protein
MTQEEKDLLLQDLSARLRYGVKVQVCNVTEYTPILKGILDDDLFLQFDYVTKPIKNGDSTYNLIEDNIKPYLRPMSSMTLDEFKELATVTELQYDQLELMDWGNDKTLEFYLSEVPQYCVIKVFDRLKKKQFDYRGMITMGLALEAPEGMYKKD